MKKFRRDKYSRLQIKNTSHNADLRAVCNSYALNPLYSIDSTD